MAQHSFGYKLVDRGCPRARMLTERALAEGRPIEIGLYFAEPETLAYYDAVLPGSGLPLCVHLDHRVVNLYKAAQQPDLLRRQIEQALAWGADYLIDHLALYPLARPLAYRQRVLERVLEQLAAVRSLVSEYGLPIHIENTFDDLDLYQGLFEGIAAAGLAGYQFCFDIGHAKVWSNAGMEQWLPFLHRLRDSGRALHFHLHANSGVLDEHLSLQQAQAEGHTGPDEFTGGRDFFSLLAQLDQAFPEARKIFEVPPEQAEENMSLAMRHIP